MSSSIYKLDREIARSFLNAISHVPIPMNPNQHQSTIVSSQLTDDKGNLFDENSSAPRSNIPLGLPSNTNIIPMYCDVVIDTVCDYDTKQTETYYYNPTHPQKIIPQENSIPSPGRVDRLDEFTVSIDFPHDYESISSPVQYENLSPMKNVRFHDHVPGNNIETSSIAMDQYYFYPERASKINNKPSTIRYITTPFFCFPPVFNPNYAICIPTSRPSLHAYLTSPCESLSYQYPIRL